jgi:restriction endonuclease Mrr
VTLPTYRDVDLALAVELIRARTAVRPADTYAGVASHFPQLTPSDFAMTRQDGRTKVFQNMIHWARDHLRVKGMLTNNRAGFWQTNDMASSTVIEELTSKGIGRSAAESFMQSSSKLHELLGVNWAATLRERVGSAETVSDSPPFASLNEPESTVVAMTAAPDPQPSAPPPKPVENDEQVIRRLLLARLNTISGYEFEQIIARVLDATGLRNSQVVGRSGDEGVDIMAELHSPFVSAKVAVQVKRHSANVGPKDISYLRDRWSRRADRLLFVTTSDFTAGAREVAAEPDKEVVLVNGRRLVDVMVEFGLGVRTRPLVAYDLEEDFFTR